ncbi:hypothetical protein CFP65_0521 [Kitasatospora sp. MMS16-BH015]|uniref:DUF4253 domain-containing protein n=1 Tax=Kitasatospora sp. MMS16-BH015 TaxID=2018025 RepID=UPI000CA23D23|nr:DUF4253 domain-containing protein [Kitasatospora sp. MMS16-BH015]AUG75484.1 hypothetical protein CFP65_0521 [Kitasatospora sp. MMS16-BH015]
MTPELLSVVRAALPAGRMIRSDEGNGEVRALWMSDGPTKAGLWAQLYGDHRRTGVWPLLLDSRDPHDGEFRPWGAGELFPERMSSPEAHDAAELLGRWWRSYTSVDDEEDVLSPADRLAVTAPFGRVWPGPAPALRPTADPMATAVDYARHFLARRPHSRLGLVAAGSGAHALAAVGWDGPVNYANDTAEFAAVVADWEERFGARVVGVGSATLHLSVAAPPTTATEALLVAAEHFAFCPDNIWQNHHPHTVAAYAGRLIGCHGWDFWWD